MCQNISNFCFFPSINKIKNSYNKKIDKEKQTFGKMSFNNDDDNFKFQFFFKKFEKLDQYLELSDNSLIFPCNCIYPVHKECLTKLTVFTQNYGCSYCKDIYIFKGLAKDHVKGSDIDVLNLCEKLNKLNLLTGFVFQFLFLFAILTGLIIALMYLPTNESLNSIFFFWKDIIIILLFLFFVAVLVNFLIKINEINQLKAVKYLDIANVDSKSYDYEELVKSSSQILHSFLLVNFDISYEDILAYKEFRNYSDCNTYLDDKLAQVIMTDDNYDDNYDEDLKSYSYRSYENFDSENFNLDNENEYEDKNNQVNDSNSKNLNEDNSSLPLNLNKDTSKENKQIKAAFYVKELTENIINIPDSSLNIAIENSKKNEEKDILTLNNNANPINQNTQINQEKNQNLSITVKNNDSKEHFQSTLSHSKSNEIAGITKSSTKRFNSAKEDSSVKMQVDEKKISPPKRPRQSTEIAKRSSKAEILALEYTQGIKAIEEYNGEFNETINSIASKILKKSDYFKMIKTPEKPSKRILQSSIEKNISNPDFAKNCRRCCSDFDVTFKSSKPVIDFDVSKKSSIDAKPVRDLLSKVCYENLFVDKNSLEENKNRKVEILQNAKTSVTTDLPKDKKEFIKYIDRAGFYKEEGSFEDIVKPLSEKDRLKSAFFKEKIDIVSNSFLSSSKSDIEDSSDLSPPKEKVKSHTSFKDIVKILVVPENEDLGNNGPKVKIED